MREPTREEIIEGIANGVYKFMRQWYEETKWSGCTHGVPSRVQAGIAAGLRKFLEEHPEVVQK